jgi:alkylation response protein AidB-like acyl-CoA dehydrogenase
MIEFRPTELSASERVLRDEVREFLAAELPRGSFEPGLGMAGAKNPEFSRKLGERGWLGMALPTEYGGHARSAVDRFVVVAELLRWGAPVGHHWVADRQSGPVIAKFGTEEQKHRFLPRICSGELSFCIGMSEPDSGSDLASISTRALRDGDGWVLNGRKIWTTSAHENDWIIVLCRTTPRDEVDDKRQGLSQLIVDLKAPGVTATPIPFIDGSADFCEVVFDNVFVPDELVLGEIGQGWSQNTSELAYERGGPDRWLSSYGLIEELLRRESGTPSSELVELLGTAAAQYWVLHNLSLSVARAIDNREAPAIESSLVKEMGTRFEQEIVTAVRSYVDEPPNGSSDTTFGRLLLGATLTQPSFTIRGGTNEVLRSVASKGLRPSGGVPTAQIIEEADPMVAETVDRIFSAACTPEEIERAELTGWSEPTWDELSEAGFPWVGIPETQGGSGGSLYDLAAILASVGRFAAPVPVAETAMVGGWCLAEAGLGLPAGPIAVAEAPVEIIDNRLRIDARVAWARHAGRIVALAELAGSPHVFSLRSSQVQIEHGSNLAGEARDRVVADIAIAEVAQAEFGSGFSPVAHRGALSRVIMASGALAAMAQMTIDYTNERRQFGKPVATFQAVQQHLVTAAQCAARANMAASTATRALAGGNANFEIAAARVVVDDAITIGTRAAHQAHGAMGVTREYPLHQLTRRLWSWQHEWGTTKQWRRQLGNSVAEAGADELFPSIAT